MHLCRSIRLGDRLGTPWRAKGNFGLGSATAGEAEALSRDWVREGCQVATDGKILVSPDRMRQFRPPSFKSDLNKYQANSEQRVPGRSLGNGSQRASRYIGHAMNVIQNPCD